MKNNKLISIFAKAVIRVQIKLLLDCIENKTNKSSFVGSRTTKYLAKKRIKQSIKGEKHYAN